jgi:hypothetical protein
MSRATEIEKENLEAHVELCAQRYDALEKRLSSIEDKVAAVYAKLEDSNTSMAKVIIGSAATVAAGLLGTIATILMKF